MGKHILTYAAIIVSLLFATHTFSQEKANKETIKKADESFEAGLYYQAKKLYNQLVTYYPKDAAYNYKYGACILFTESDKSSALKYLEYAVTQPEVDAAAYYYLGKGYHYNYRFNQAIKYYNQFKSKADPKELKALPVEQELRMANNGFGLLKDVSEPKVYEKKQLSERDFYLSYELPEGEKLIMLPSFLRSSEDKAANYAPLVNIKNGSDTLIVSGKAKGGEHTDLYMLILNASGDLEERIPIANLNTPYDEAYPYLDKASNTFYFSSKGHTSMGGYDLFRSTYNPASGSFGAPQNLDYAYNTPDDDILYVPSPDGNAYFSSSRNNDAGKISVFKVDSARRGLQHILLVGSYKADGSKVATITVEDSETGAKQTPFETRSKDGFYAVKLKADHRYRFLVEPEGSQTIHAGIVEIPSVSALKPLKQEMFIIADGDREKLVIKNLFDEEPNAEDELLIANFLRDLSSLDQIGEEEIERNIALSNDEIIADLTKRKETLTQQANELNGYVASAYDVAQQKSAEAKEAIAKVDQLEQALPTDQTDSAYQEQKEVVEQEQAKARAAAIEAASALEYAKTLERLAAKRSDEAKQVGDVIAKGNSLKAEGKRNELIQEYLAVNEQVVVNNKPVKTQAAETIENEAIAAKKKASQAKLIYQDLYDEEERLKKTIAFTEGQVKQAKKAKMKEQLEADLAELQNDLAELSPQVEEAYFDFKKKEAIADALGNQNSAIGKTMAELEPSTTGNAANYAVIANEVNNQYKTTTSYGDREDYQFRADQAEATEELVVEASEPEESEPEPITEPEVASTTTYDLSSSPYEEHFTSQETEVAAIQDPLVKNAATQGILIAKNEAIDSEIAYLQGLGNPEQYTDKVENLEIEKAENIAQQETLQQQAKSLLVDEEYQPTETMMSYPSIQDMEDQYYFEYDEVRNQEIEERLNATNEINERYIAQIQENVSSLKEAQLALPPSSSDYKALGDEIAALEELVAKKEAQTDYNNQVISAAGSAQYAMPGLSAALAANTVTEEAPAPVTEIESEPIAENNPVEETPEQTPVEEPVEEIPANSIAEDQQEENIIAATGPQPTVDQNGVPEGGFRYFDDINAVRSAPIYVGTSPYNETYESQVTTAEQIDDPVTRTGELISANDAWLTEINKEMESLTYMSKNAGSESTREVLEDKLITLSDQRVERQAELNRLNALQVQLAEEGYVAQATEPAETNTVEEPEPVDTEVNDPVIPAATTPAETIETEPVAEQTEIEEPATVEETVLNTPEEVIEEPDFNEPEAIREEPEQLAENEDIFSEEPAQEEQPLADVATTDEGVAELTALTTTYQEEANLAQTSFEEADQQIGQLQQELVRTKKKKDKAAVQAKLDQANEDLIVQRAMLQWANAKVENVSAASETLMANPLAERPSVVYLAQAESKQNDAQFIQQEIQEKRDEIGAERKKKKRQQMQEDLDDLIAEGKKKEIDAEQSALMAKAVQEAEVITLKNATAFGSSIVVELPAAERTLTTQEQEQLLATPEYQEYTATQETFTKSIQEADVIYASAARLEQEGRSLIAQATQAQGAESDSLKQAGDAKVAEALQKRQQAKEMTRDAYYDMNMANQKLLAMEDLALRTDLIAVTQGNFAALTYTEEGEIDVIPAQLTADIFQQEAQDVAYYGEEKPIPVDVKLPDGVVFKVQVGAFRNPIPSETFRGFAPIVGESTGTGLTRYTAGLFKTFENANDAKTGIRDLGYSDAFVVAYRNGERISIAEARGGATTSEGTPALAATDGGTPAPVTELADNPLAVNNQPVQEITDAAALDVQPVADRAPLFYTVQIGVYSDAVSPAQLFNISPINSDVTPSGLIRYSTGVFNTVAAATAAKDQIVTIGIQDAFVTAYRNGERVSVAEAQQSNAGGAPAVVEQPADNVVEQPVVDDTTVPEDEPVVVNEQPTQQPATTTVEEQPGNDEPETITIDGFAEDVLPPASAESDNAYRVKVGPYEGQVPVNEAGVILEMNSVGITIKRQDEQTIYYIGNYRTPSEADRLLQIVNSKGLPSAEVVKFENGLIVE